jgi:hypothetical protein
VFAHEGEVVVVARFCKEKDVVVDASFGYSSLLFNHDDALQYAKQLSYQGDVLHFAKQIFSLKLLQVTKYCIMRECENIHSWISLSGDSAFIHQNGIHGFKFPKRFLEISCRDLTLFKTFFIFKQPKRPLYQHPLDSMALAFAFPLWTLINALSSSSKQSDIHSMASYPLSLYPNFSKSGPTFSRYHCKATPMSLSTAS